MSRDRSAPERAQVSTPAPGAPDRPLPDGPEALLQGAPCGVLSTTPDGLLTGVNRTLCEWLGRAEAELVGRCRLVDLLSPGGRLYHETHYAPMLRLHGEVRELAMELVDAAGGRLPVLVEAVLDPATDGRPERVRIAVFRAGQRRRYERELLRAKETAEAAEEHARALARTLQQTLIPPTPPSVPGLDVAAAYRPAGEGTEVGGDFYDVFEVATDDWVVVLGDVCGKGVEAAVVTALARYTLRAAAVAYASPASALENLNEVLRHHPSERFCTVVMMRLRRAEDGWSVQVAVGGHPPPLLLAAGADPEPCAAHGPLVGVLEHVEFVECTLRLRPGTSVLLHTDGVTEARRGQELYGEERTRAALARAGADPRTAVDLLMAEVLDFQDDRPRDDVAVLAVGVPPRRPID